MRLGFWKAFLLTGARTWVGKLAYLTANPMTLQEGRRAIAQAISDHRVKPRGPGCPRVNLLAWQPFRFNTSRTPLPRDIPAHYSPDEGQTPQWPSWGQGHNRRWRDQQPWSPRFPSPSLDRDFESDRSSISTVSSISSHSDHLDRSGCSRWGRRHREETRAWRSISPFLKMKMSRMQWLIKVGDGTWQCIGVLAVGIILSCHMPSGPYKATQEN